ncbi:MAG TPA: NADH-quinone oxidoreductase subunit A [Spirochaetota bacterium]|nr:NADH-quinone oxidoreductase subunit A [Spirochaetota bacterium]
MELLLSPPIVFIMVLAISAGALALFSRLAYRSKVRNDAKHEPYSCGEELPSHLIQPDYSQFFHFAFYFTILHVVALFISTVPTETAGAIAIALLYIAGAVIGMFILLEK